jgi:hypothetical protein
MLQEFHGDIIDGHIGFRASLWSAAMRVAVKDGGYR